MGGKFCISKKLLKIIAFLIVTSSVIYLGWYINNNILTKNNQAAFNNGDKVCQSIYGNNSYCESVGDCNGNYSPKNTRCRVAGTNMSGACCVKKLTTTQQMALDKTCDVAHGFWDPRTITKVAQWFKGMGYKVDPIDITDQVTDKAKHTGERCYIYSLLPTCSQYQGNWYRDESAFFLEDRLNANWNPKKPLARVEEMYNPADQPQNLGKKCYKVTYYYPNAAQSK